MKICCVCKKQKELDCFHKNKSRKDGLCDICKECRKNDRLNNLDKYRSRDKVCDEKRKDDRKIYRDENKDKSKQYHKEYYINNKEYINKRNKRWADSHRNEHRLYMAERINSDIGFRLAKNLRTRLYLAIKNNWKTGSAVSDLGCSIDELKVYLQNRFKEGMSWENYGKYGWHIDHIIPLTKFNLEDREDLLKACHYTNLQPMWMEENISKSNKILS